MINGYLSYRPEHFVHTHNHTAHSDNSQISNNNNKKVSQMFLRCHQCNNVYHNIQQQLSGNIEFTLQFTLFTDFTIPWKDYENIF